jgi:transposase
MQAVWADLIGYTMAALFRRGELAAMVNKGTEGPTTSGGSTIVMGIELSKKGWLVALRTPLADKLSLHRFAAGDAKGLLELAQRARAAAATALGTRVAVASCYEAGYDGFWLYRVLAAADIDNCVVDPASIHVDRRARSDRHERLAKLTTGDGRSLQPQMLAEIRRELARLELLLQQIAELETAREAAIGNVPDETTAPVPVRHTRSLRRLTAMGPENWAVLANLVRVPKLIPA